MPYPIAAASRTQSHATPARRAQDQAAATLRRRPARDTTTTCGAEHDAQGSRSPPSSGAASPRRHTPPRHGREPGSAAQDVTYGETRLTVRAPPWLFAAQRRGATAGTGARTTAITSAAIQHGPTIERVLFRNPRAYLVVQHSSAAPRRLDDRSRAAPLRRLRPGDPDAPRRPRPCRARAQDALRAPSGQSPYFASRSGSCRAAGARGAS